MANFLERIGLGSFMETEEDLMNIIGFAVENGKPVTGYYGNPYINHHIGGAQLIVRTRVDHENKKIEMSGFDTHADGNAVWKVRIHEIALDNDEDPLCRRVMVTGEDGTGMTVVNIVNADVLPSFAKDEIYRLQMIAFPTDIRYYASSEEYETNGSIDTEDKHWLMGEGAVLPIGFMSNHMVAKGEQIDETKEYDPETDDIVAVRGEVKALYYGMHEYGEESRRAYIRCIIDTEYGDLEIDHDIDAVDEEYRDNIKVGATVVAMVVLSGDAANYEYADGFVKDEDNNLRLVRYTFIEGDPERLRLVLSDDAEYTSDSNGKTYKGKDEIISRIKFVQDNGDHKYYAHMATITSIDDNEIAEIVYPVGTRCVVLASDDERNYESIAFVTTDDQGNIVKIHTSMDSNYHFKIDEFPHVLDEYEIPETYHECMVTRARFHGFHEKDTDEMIELVKVAQKDEAALNQLLAVRSEDVDLIRQDIAENLFGYIFAKGIEHYMFSELELIPVVTYNRKVFDGIFDTHAEGVLKDKLEYAMKYGKQFLTDFNNYTGPEKMYIIEMLEALKYVHALGRTCAPDYLGDEEYEKITKLN